MFCITVGVDTRSMLFDLYRNYNYKYVNMPSDILFFLTLLELLHSLVY